VLPPNETCVEGFDNVGFVMGTSSTLFNAIILDFNTTVSLPSIIENGIQRGLNDFGATNNDISDWNANRPSNLIRHGRLPADTVSSIL